MLAAAVGDLPKAMAGRTSFALIAKLLGPERFRLRAHQIELSIEKLQWSNRRFWRGQPSPQAVEAFVRCAGRGTW